MSRFEFRTYCEFSPTQICFTLTFTCTGLILHPTEHVKWITSVTTQNCYTSTTTKTFNLTWTGLILQPTEHVKWKLFFQVSCCPTCRKYIVGRSFSHQHLNCDDNVLSSIGYHKDIIINDKTVTLPASLAGPPTIIMWMWQQYHYHLDVATSS